MADNAGELTEITRYEYEDYNFDDQMIESRFRQEAIQWLDEKIVASLGAQDAIEHMIEQLDRARGNIFYLGIPKPFWNEWAAKLTVKLLRKMIDWSMRILMMRSRAITKQFNATVEKHS